jgi:hypothetical protein
MQELIDKMIRFEKMFGFSPHLSYLDCLTAEAYRAFEKRLDLALLTGHPGDLKPMPEWPDGMMVD